MDCQEFIERLDDYLNGTLGQAEARLAGTHLDGCARCRELARASAELAELELQPPPGFAASVLERTSGSACQSARGRLCGFVDSLLEPLDRDLVRMHLAGCPNCSGIAAALQRIAIDMPALAEMKPDPGFVGDVLSRTLTARTHAQRRFDRWSAAWQRLLQRPRFAMEGAYLGTFALVLVFGIPGSPFATVPQAAMELLRFNPIAEVRQPLVRIENRVSDRLGALWDTTTEEIVGTSRNTASRAIKISTELAKDAKSDFGTLLERFASEQETNETEQSSDGDNRTDGDKP